MNREEELLKNRIKELADRCYHNNIYTYTEFLSLADAAVYYSMDHELNYVSSELFGGNDICERKILRFGSEMELSYSEEFPITTLCIKPLMAKFSDELSHRDILGSLMNLGIERSVLGDIYIKDNKAYVFCLDRIADYICDNITRVKHTSVICEIVKDSIEIELAEKEDKIIQVQSERIDGVLAKVYNLSRSQVIPLFTEKKVFVNGRLMENNSHVLKANDAVTLRGYGRFEYSGVVGESRKGKLNVLVKK